jgi:hypothetical protein
MVSLVHVFVFSRIKPIMQGCSVLLLTIRTNQTVSFYCEEYVYLLEVDILTPNKMLLRWPKFERGPHDK